MFQFKLHSASNLPKADLVGSIDAFAIINIPIQGGLYFEAKTLIIKNNYDPKWKLTCPIIHNPDTSREVIIVIMDHDKVGENDFVCQCRIPFVNLLTPCKKQRFKMDCEKKYVPHRKGEDCVIVYSSCLLPPFSSFAEDVKSRNHETTVDTLKNQILMRIPSTGYYLKAKFGKELKLSIYDTDSNREGLAEFVLGSHNVTMKNHFSLTPKIVNEYLNVYRNIKLKSDLFLSDLPNIQIVISKLNTVVEVTEDQVATNHGWFGSYPKYSDAKNSNTLKNVIFNDESESIFMIEDYFFVESDWDSSNSDEKVGLLDPYKREGYYLEIRHDTKQEFYMSNLATPKKLNGTGKTFSQTSEVKDVPYPISLSDFCITVYKKQDTHMYQFFAFIK